MLSIFSKRTWRLCCQFCRMILPSVGLLHMPIAIRAQETAASIRTPSAYILGPGDQLMFSGIAADEIVNKPFRINPEGEVSLPMAGRLLASGLTLPQFEEALNKRLSIYIREPQVVATIAEFRSQPVSVVGAVKSPGMHQLEGRKSLTEIIALAGGFREDAGNVIKLTRELEWGVIPLAGVTTDPSNKFSLAEVKISEILEAKNPADNISIMPHDVISVPKGELVYVIGAVNKVGGFVLAEKENMSVLQALSLAEGLERTADSKHAKVLRVRSSQEQRIEIAVNVKKILDGTSLDVPLQPGDILFIPDSTAKRIAMRTMEAAVQTATGVVIWRR
jgi:polysaccharide biosynthesis/export protein